MAVRLIKRSWWVDFRVDHTRYRKRSPENSRTGALAYEAMLRQKLARGEPVDKANCVATQQQTFEHFAGQWFEQYVIPNNKYSEQRAKKYILDASLVPFFGKTPVGKITAQHIEQYKARQVKQGVKNKTLKNRLTVLNKCLNTAYEWLELGPQPPKITWPKCAPPQTDYLSPEECELLLSHAHGVVYEMVFTALRTGMRQGELKGLQWGSIDWQTQIVTVRHSRCDYTKTLGSPKNNRERHVPLDIDVYEMLHKRKKNTGYVFTDADGQPFDHKRLTRRLARVRKNAGLRRIGWHTLRHTFATQLAMRGVPLTTVQTLLGHSNITTTMRYAHVAPSTLRMAIDMLNPKRLLNADFGQPVGNQWFAMQQHEAIQKSMAAKQKSPSGDFCKTCCGGGTCTKTAEF
jgi:integrase